MIINQLNQYTQSNGLLSLKNLKSNYIRPKYTRDKPNIISTKPNLLKERSGELMTFRTQAFIVVGKAK
jgi:hypothetical protein